MSAEDYISKAIEPMKCDCLESLNGDISDTKFIEISIPEFRLEFDANGHECLEQRLNK